MANTVYESGAVCQPSIELNPMHWELVQCVKVVLEGCTLEGAFAQELECLRWWGRDKERWTVEQGKKSVVHGRVP